MKIMSYYNWADYNYQHNYNANSNSAKAYATSGLNMNCGTGYAHSCSNPSLYGPATLSSGGELPGSTLTRRPQMASPRFSTATIRSRSIGIRR